VLDDVDAILMRSRLLDHVPPETNPTV
jgi:hypothetical protein